MEEIQDPSTLLRQAFERLVKIPDSEWALFEKDIFVQNLKKGDLWIAAGEPANNVSFIHQGLVRVYYILQDGSEFTRNFRREGEFMASYAATLIEKKSEFNIVAIENTQLISFPYKSFSKSFSRHCCWQEFARRLVEELYITYQRREYELLCMSAGERYENFQREFQPILNRVSQAVIANYLGITPVSLSRLLGNKHREKKKSK